MYGTLSLLTINLIAAELPDPGKPRQLDPDEGIPTLDIPLPQEGAEEDAFKGLEIPPKRERLPDERTIQVTQFNVGRLIPDNQVSGECIKTQTPGFCLVEVKQPDLDELLSTVISEYQSEFTIFELEDVALRVTNYFRNQDLILDTAFIPPQDVQNNTVAIHVLQGRLGHVSVKGNEDYTEDVLISPFQRLLSQPVTRSEITHSLLTVWDFPGLALSDRKAQLTFYPGSSVGETDIEMEVFEEEYPFNLKFSLDNAGSEYSGVYRGTLSVDFNNPTGSADQLSVALSANADPANGEFYALDYFRPLFTSDYRVSIGASKNDFELSQEFEDFTGVTEEAYIGVDRVFMQSFRSRLGAGIRFSRKNAKTFFMGEEEDEDKLAVLNLMADYMFTDQVLVTQGANQTRLVVDYAHGFGDLMGSMESENDPDSSRTIASNEKAGAKFDKLNLGLARKQRFIADTALWFRFNGQYSPDPLVSLEQFAMGGPNSVRAYPTAEFLRDKGYFVSLEWATELPFLSESAVPAWLAGDRETTWGRAITLSLFADYAEGWLNDAIDASQEESETLDGIGIGLNFQTARTSLNMSLATPLGDREPSNDEDPQFFAHLMIQFY
ncbi:MAG: ShlB/FhaC/HecB family hemolysin secretion/activation protein [Gammaproteobacteria bacterium]|nr:ShlB/FhaC/HecB family hemolysin secretion/activation protein [Gammaproteobacteria bacterium]